MHTIPKAAAAYPGLMVQKEKNAHSGSGGDGAAAREVSLADGTGEGNAPIDGTSASSDPEILAGTEEEASLTSLNDDDYPENIAEAAGAVDDDSEGAGKGGKTSGSRQAPASEENTSGEAVMPDEAAGVDLRGGSATPDAPGKQ